MLVVNKLREPGEVKKIILTPNVVKVDLANGDSLCFVSVLSKEKLARMRIRPNGQGRPLKQVSEL